MKQIILLLSFLLLFSSLTYSQSATNVLTKEQFQDYSFIPGNYMRQLPGKPPELKGSAYTNDQWSNGTIYLNRGQKTEVLPIKYDILNNQLEIQHENKVKVLPGYEVFKFVLQQNAEEILYSNIQNYKGGKALKGFVKILVPGSIILGSHTTAEISKPNYNVALNVGEKDAKIIKKEKLYLITEGVIREIPAKKSEFMAVFGEKSQQVEQFMNANKYNHKNKQAVQLIITYYNSLAS
ncbi:hypothetical protein Q0590_19865 [Rhodocytophaga aerolata]|uniref:Uncharacterized protein n=1 Tax=Rhodocytophaga aerolata TaxID=455078 RepID=A0ABT8R8Y2_9BACT|nr:hypothetical protein [Rhodocytophaga aerolata]MDO1448544.1 hypothetical protein [Rhodocytophaga aerolata]